MRQLSQNKTIKIKWRNTFYTYVFTQDNNRYNYFYFAAAILNTVYEIRLSKINNTWYSSASYSRAIPDTYDFITTSDLSDYLKISDADTTYLKKSEATTETWTFTLEGGTTKTKQVYINA